MRALLDGMGFDIAAFQEVEMRPGDMLPEKAGGVPAGWNIRTVWSIETPGRRYGQALVSRYPVARFEAHDISVAGRESRHLLDMTCDTPWGHVRAIAGHFGLAAAERRRQAAALVDIVRREPSRSQELPTLLCGDFNEWRRNGPVSRAITRLFAGHAAPASFPARFPVLALDRIYVRGGLAIVRAAACREAAAASDHLPVIADLSL